MAKTTIVQLVDDLDGSEAQETIEFKVTDDGETWEIDLSAANLRRLSKARGEAAKARDKAKAEAEAILAKGDQDATNILAEFVNAGRMVIQTKQRRRPPVKGRVSAGATRAAAKDQNKAIREWATRKGLDVAPRGRIRAEIVEQYHREAGR